MRILVWNVHEGWLDAFVRGPHDYLLPVAADGTGGRGAMDWPAGVVDVPEQKLLQAEPDVVVLQRLEDLDEAERLLGRRLGRDIPAIFVEHNTPRDNVPDSVHPLADRDDILIVHVTYFNALFWDVGRAPSTIIEHGVVDRGFFYSGELQRIGAVINEPVRRWRSTGSDLIGRFTDLAPVDIFGMKADGMAQALDVADDVVTAAGDLAAPALQHELARRRLYLHPNRWTSLGLSLLEAMHAGLPVVALDVTDIRRAVPPEAGVVSSDIDELRRGVSRFLAEPEAARIAGAHAREFVLAHFGLEAFTARWSEVLEDWVSRRG